MEIIFAGGSHYGLGGYKSLTHYFDKIYIVKNNPCEIFEEKRPQDEIIDDFFSVECKYVFLCGYSRLISKEELDRKEFINVHGALLPKYRGMHSTFYAIMNGEDKLGITFHLVDEWMDSGDILEKCEFEYCNQKIYEINEMIDSLVEKNAGRICFNYISGEIKPQKQDLGEALFGAKRNLLDCKIDFNMSNIMLERFFKALNEPYPCPMLFIRGEMYEVVGKIQIIDRDYFGPIGRVVNIDELGAWIKCKDGVLIVTELRNYETKKVEGACSLLTIGYRL